MQTPLKHGSDAGSQGVSGTGFQILRTDEAFDVDVRRNGDQSLDSITVEIFVRVHAWCEKWNPLYESEHTDTEACTYFRKSKPG